VNTVTIKISGKRVDVEQFLVELEKTYAMMLKSKLLYNDDGGVHVFVDLDPYALRKVEAKQ
jgi:hypothetical protein